MTAGTPKTYSDIIPRIKIPKELGGMYMYDREKIYQWLWANSDSQGIIIYSCQKCSQLLKIERKMMMNIFKEFVQTGHLIQDGQKFECTYPPSQWDWGEEYLAATLSLLKDRESRKSRERYDYNKKR